MSAAHGETMSWENLIYIADFLSASGERHVTLLGGEPTVHAQCVDFIVYLLDRGFNVMMFTNGIVGRSRLAQFERHLGDAASERLTLVCNLNDPVHTPPPRKEAERLHSFLSAMGPWITPGFNIYRPDFTLDFLFDLIGRYGLRRHLRVGVAHPIPGKRTEFIHTEDLGRVVERFLAYGPLFEACRVRPRLDCGFPICKFSDEQLGRLYRLGGQYHFGCGPAFDIAPDMSVYHCFPLANYKRKSLFEFDTLAQIEAHFALLRDQIKCEISGIYSECDGCRFQEDRLCSGGGLCRVVGRFIDEAPIRFSEIENEIAKVRVSGQ